MLFGVLVQEACPASVCAFVGPAVDTRANGGRGSARYRVLSAASSGRAREGLRLAAQGRRPSHDRTGRAGGRVKDLERAMQARHATPAVAHRGAAPPRPHAGSGSAGTPAPFLVNRDDQIRQGYPQRIDQPHDRGPPWVGLPELDARQAAHRQLRFPRQAFLGPAALLAQGPDSGRQGRVSGRRGLGHNMRTIADP